MAALTGSKRHHGQRDDKKEDKDAGESFHKEFLSVDRLSFIILYLYGSDNPKFFGYSWLTCTKKTKTDRSGPDRRPLLKG